MKLLAVFIQVILVIGCIDIKKGINPRISIIQEFPLEGGQSFYWFIVENGSLSPGVNYFQVATERCDVSVESANASSDTPLQIHKIVSDTVFILTATELINLKKSNVRIVGTKFSHDLYNIKKAPPKNQ